ncbi:MAG TPA: zeta toxin family protein [Alphaproteobacteria bacterium]|nr:zeta toxin family protein [Alphaproteobacteria bacterium]
MNKIIPYDDIREDLLPYARDVIATALDTYSAEDNCVFIHTIGLQASGKSTYTKHLHRHLPGYAYVGFDKIMEDHPRYWDCFHTHGAEQALEEWEKPARAIGYHLLQTLLENKRSIIFEHSAAHKDHPRLIKTAMDWGYITEMHYIPCSPELSIGRAKKRKRKGGRHVPEERIWERHALLEELLPIYRHLPHRFVTVKSVFGDIYRPFILAQQAAP